MEEFLTWVWFGLAAIITLVRLSIPNNVLFHKWGLEKRWGAVKHPFLDGIALRVFLIFDISLTRFHYIIWFVRSTYVNVMPQYYNNIIILCCIQLYLLGIKTLFPISKIRSIASYWHMCIAYICSCGASPLSYTNHRTHVHKISSNLIYPLNILIRAFLWSDSTQLWCMVLNITSKDRIIYPQIRLWVDLSLIHILIWVLIMYHRI